MNTTVKMTKRLTYTEAFRTHFSSLFDDAESKHRTSFDLTVNDFDSFIVSQKFVEYIPDKSSREWADHVATRNEIRDAINAISERGMHGVDPAFRIDPMAGGVYRINLFIAICDKAVTNVALRIKKFVENKNHRYQLLAEFMAKNSGKLPPYITFNLKRNNRELTRILETFGGMLKGHAEDVEADYKAAVTYLKDSAPEVLDTAPNGGDPVGQPDLLEDEPTDEDAPASEPTK